MKLRKSLFMLCAAGLSLCACNSDDIKDQMPEGYGAVEVKIVPPQTRATTGTSGDNNAKVDVTGDVYVTLYATTGGGTVKISANDFPSNKTVKFWNVTEPTKVEVSMNGGVESYNSVSIVDQETQISYNVGLEQNITPEQVTRKMQADPASIPVYGVATLNNGLNLTTDIEENEGQKYQMYKATINLTIPVARLEVVVKRESASSNFSTLNAYGVYLDHIKPTGSGTITDYISSKDVAKTAENNSTATGVNAILEDAFASSSTFIAMDAQIPGNSQVFAYNFYGDADPANVPYFKILFKDAARTDGTTIPATQYAMITQYKEDSQPIALENGNIYRITAVLEDTNVQPDESGEDISYAVSVTVEKAQWTIKDVTGVWE